MRTINVEPRLGVGAARYRCRLIRERLCEHWARMFPMMHEELEHPDSEWPLGSVIKAEDAAEHLASIAVQLHDALGQMAEEMVYEKDR